MNYIAIIEEISSELPSIQADLNAIAGAPDIATKVKLSKDLVDRMLDIISDVLAGKFQAKPAGPQLQAINPANIAKILQLIQFILGLLGK